MTTQQFWLTAWDWNPVVIGVCLLALFVYAKSVRFRLPKRSGYFIAAVVLFFLTLASPVNTLANGYLFCAHMVQHLLLLLVIPPLALLSLPEWKRTDEKNGLLRHRFRVHPFAAWLAGLSAMWVWHDPTLCTLATTTQPWRVAQIISCIVLGTLFWWPIVGPHIERRLAPLLGVAYLFSACVGCTILGILITFAPVGAICAVYVHPADPLGIVPLIRDNWGITAATDQQAGGLMMWVPACGIYISGVITLLARWYKAGEAESGAPAPTVERPAPVYRVVRATGEKA